MRFSVAMGMAVLLFLVTSPSRAQGPDKALHVLVIGINTFQESQIHDLTYCRPDAETIAALFQNPRFSLYHPIRLTTLLDREATLNNVCSALDKITRNARPEDAVVIYFSAHGFQQDQGQTFWVLHDTRIDQASLAQKKIRIVPESALSQKEIGRALDRIKAHRVLVLVDCCFSAATVVSFQRGVKYQAEEVTDPFAGFKGEGRVIITASKGTEMSVELPALGHGVFTYHLVNGLKGPADDNHDNVVEVWEIWQYLSRKVSQDAQKAGNPQNPTISTTHLTHGFPVTTYNLTTGQTTDEQPPLESAPEQKKYARALKINWVTIGNSGGETFDLSAHEITNHQFQEFLEDHPEWRKDRIPSQFQDGDYLKHWPGPDGPPPDLIDHPVVFVSWYAAKAFAEWAGGRLPTEKEWMMAAGFRKNKVFYPWAGPWNPRLCHNRENAADMGRTIKTVPVNDFESGAAIRPGGKIYQLSGNVWEWVSDWIFAAPGARGETPYLEKPGPAEQNPAINRLIKGGSFLADRLGCDLTSSTWADPRLCAEDGGIRVVR